MPSDPVPTWCFALVVVRRGDRFLVVHERKHGQSWYLPAGRVEPGETFAEAAARETLEETGVPVRLEGVLRVEHTPLAATARLRIVFTAVPVDERAPKSTADEHSLEARWVTLDELRGLSLRDDEVRELFELVARGARAAPMSILTG